MVRDKRALGVDCASRKSGLAVLEGTKLIFHEPYNTLLRQGYSDRELAVELNNFSKRIRQLVNEYKVDITVVEFTAGFRNHQTNRMLSYFEAAAIMGATKSKVLRARTVKARRDALGKKYVEKQAVIARVRSIYGSSLTEDEAEAIVFALAGIKQLA